MKTLNKRRSIGLCFLFMLGVLALTIPASASCDPKALRNEGTGGPWNPSCGNHAFTLNAPAVFVQTLGTEDGAFSNPTGQVIADQFILSMDATITSVTWYGFYGVDLDPSVATLDFDIHFFEDSAGLPGTEIYDETVSTQVNDSGFKVTNPDPDYYFNGRTIYEFQADLDLTLSITAGDTMWIEIAENDDATEPSGDTQWLWSNGRPEPPCGLVSKWPGDGNADDVEGDNDGTLENGATFAPGLVNQAFSFDGVDDYVQIPYDASFNLSSFTLQAWVKFTQNAVGRIISRPSSGSPHSFFRLQNTWGRLGGAVQGEEGENISTCSDISFADGNWHMCTFVHNVAAGEIRTYVDGISSSSYSKCSPGGMANNVNGITIGSYDGSEDFFEGLIDEVAIYNCALDDDEILAIFLANAAEAATEDLIEDIEEMGLPEGTENSLVSKLENAIKSMEKGQDNAAAKQLNAFIKQVEAQSGKKIPEADADALIAAAQSIIDNISNNGS